MKRLFVSQIAAFHNSRDNPSMHRRRYEDSWRNIDPVDDPNGQWEVDRHDSGHFLHEPEVDYNTIIQARSLQDQARLDLDRERSRRRDLDPPEDYDTPGIPVIETYIQSDVHSGRSTPATSRKPRTTDVKTSNEIPEPTRKTTVKTPNSDPTSSSTVLPGNEITSGFSKSVKSRKAPPPPPPQPPPLTPMSSEEFSQHEDTEDHTVMRLVSRRGSHGPVKISAELQQLQTRVADIDMDNEIFNVNRLSSRRGSHATDEIDTDLQNLQKIQQGRRFDSDQEEGGSSRFSSRRGSLGTDAIALELQKLQREDDVDDTRDPELGVPKEGQQEDINAEIQKLRDRHANMVSGRSGGRLNARRGSHGHDEIFSHVVRLPCHPSFDFDQTEDGGT